jgi:beta-lactamase regulating signal transducer with metallopeptidase domain
MTIPDVDASTLTAIWMILKVSVVVAAAAIADLLIRRRTSAATRHLMWTLALIGLLLLPALSLVLPGWDVGIRWTATQARDARPIADVPHAAETLGRVRGLDATTPARRSPLESDSPAFQSGATVPIFARMPWGSVLLAVYAAGVLLLLIRLMAQRRKVRRLTGEASDVAEEDWRRLFVECARRMGIQRPIRLLRGHERTMPMALGTRHPAIVIPAIADTWEEDRRRAVLLHEIAHVARHDCLTQMIAAIACALYWIHPGVWWMARRLRVERELACDDRVLTAGTHAREYAEHLLELAYALRSPRTPAFVVSMARPRQLEGRMLAVLDAARSRAVPGLRIRLAGVAITSALLVPLGGMEATGAAPDEPREPIAARDSAAPEMGSIGTPDRQPNERSASRTMVAGVKAAAAANASAQERLPGTWEIRPAKDPGFVHLKLTEKDSSSGSTVPVERLEGLTSAQLSGAGSPVRFSIRRDAGTFTFEGTVRNGVGAGTYTFAPSTTFPAELAKRGLERPSPADQYELARHDVRLALVDELTKQGYQRPSISDLVRAGHHGVQLDYLRGMGELGYRLGTVSALIKLRDHGVTPGFVRGLGEQGLSRLSADDLVRARDHGVTPEYVGGLRELGYGSLTLDQLVTARDHGVTPQYVNELAGQGHAKLPLDALVNARDHGVTPDYVRELGKLGYSSLTLEQLVTARDHGVTPEYVGGLAASGYRDLPVDSLIRLRDHGVTPQYVRELKELGYEGVSVDELVSLRDHGVTPDKIRRANDRAGKRLPPDKLRALATTGEMK